MKKIKKNKYIGSDFDDFLTKEGILEEVKLAAIKRIIAFELSQEMKKRKMTQTNMAKKLGTSRSALNRLLDPKNYSITLYTLNRLAHVLGKRLDINFH
jgi:DNA-binding Xre family transcriptional regulator